MKDDTRVWVNYAQENIAAAKLLVEQKLYNPFLQNVQQAIEKILKALLLEKVHMLRCPKFGVHYKRLGAYGHCLNNFLS